MAKASAHRSAVPPFKSTSSMKPPRASWRRPLVRQPPSALLRWRGWRPPGRNRRRHTRRSRQLLHQPSRCARAAAAPQAVRRSCLRGAATMRFMARVALGGFECPGHDGRKVAAGIECPRRQPAPPGCIVADKVAHRAVSTGAVAVAGGAHDRPGRSRPRALSARVRPLPARSFPKLLRTRAARTPGRLTLFADGGE